MYIFSERVITFFIFPVPQVVCSTCLPIAFRHLLKLSCAYATNKFMLEVLGMSGIYLFFLPYTVYVIHSLTWQCDQQINALIITLSLTITYDSVQYSLLLVNPKTTYCFLFSYLYNQPGHTLISGITLLKSAIC